MILLITQPVTTTQMRRDPKGLLKQVEKEKFVPVLMGSKIVGAFVSHDQLKAFYDEISFLKKERFAEEILRVSQEYDQKGGSGPFKNIDELEAHLKSLME